MCGIAGYGGTGSTESLRKVAQAIARRGPDDQGFYEAPGVGFAFRRLSIIDVKGGHQPLSNEDGSVWAMLNGEIYGFECLRDSLISAGHVFCTKSDTEVIVHAYEEWGDECFEKLDGMFAVALWDAKRQRLILARDRIGKKPLYWTVRNNTLWFASEIKALIAAESFMKQIDFVSLGLYFRNEFVNTPRSMFAGVNKLEPASALFWSKGTIEKTIRFWRPNIELDLPETPEEAVLGLRERIDLSVKKRLVSDVPLGLFLSGGIDSAVIAESAARQSSRQLKSFTIGFEDASHDERSSAREVAKALRLEYHEDILSTDSALEMLDQATEVLDEPLADPAILPQLLLAKFARNDVTVALSGDGGDELLLGYQHILAHSMVNHLASLPHFLRTSIGAVLRRMPASNGYFSFGFKAQRLGRGLAEDNPWKRDVLWRGAFTSTELSNLLLPEVRLHAEIESAERLMQKRSQEISHAGFWQSWSWAYIRTYLMDDVLVKVDRATMWYGLEARCPLLDQSVVKYLLTLPDSMKIGAWKNKRIFKELLRDVIHERILNRPKHGFGIPVSKWLRGSLNPLLRELTSSRLLDEQGLFSSSAVERLIGDHMRGSIDRRKELWALLMFQLWYHKFVQ
jgi:asparagine synthase (glutamine-hydrolysing)